VKKTTTTHVPAQTREQARRTGGKVYNDDGTWHYGSNQPATTTATKK
jgi:predicted oxidoreductase